MPIPPWEGRDFSGCAVFYAGGFGLFMGLATFFLFGPLQGLLMGGIPAALVWWINGEKRWLRAAKKVYETHGPEFRTVRLTRKEAGYSRYQGKLYAYTIHLSDRESLRVVGVTAPMLELLDQEIPIQLYRDPDDDRQPVVIAHDQAIMISDWRAPWAKGPTINRT